MVGSSGTIGLPHTQHTMRIGRNGRLFSICGTLDSGACSHGYFRRQRLAPLRLVGRFVQSRTASVAIEFALVSIPLSIMVLFMLAIALTLFWIQSLEFSTIEAARAIRTGSVQESGLTAEQFKQRQVCLHLLPGLQCENVVVSVNRVEKTWDAGRTSGVYQYIDKALPALQAPALDQPSAPFCPGGPGDMVYVDVVYKAAPIVGLFWPSGLVREIGGEKVLLIRATAAVMNEPYQATRSAPC